MTSEELNTILGRGICYPKIEKAHRILVTGMNPSFRQGDPAREDFVCEYEYQGIVEDGKDRYYLAFDKLFPEAYKREVAYMDLLNFRETDQNTVWKFCNDPKGLELVAENLRLSQLFIEQVVRPRLIMVKNRGSWCFWGKEAKADENIWMGYRFEHLESLPSGAGEPHLPVGNELEGHAGVVHKPFPILRHREIAHAGIARPAVRDDVK